MPEIKASLAVSLHHSTDPKPFTGNPQIPKFPFDKSIEETLQRSLTELKQLQDNTKITVEQNGESITYSIYNISNDTIVASSFNRNDNSVIYFFKGLNLISVSLEVSSTSARRGTLFAHFRGPQSNYEIEGSPLALAKFFPEQKLEETYQHDIELHYIDTDNDGDADKIEFFKDYRPFGTPLFIPDDEVYLRPVIPVAGPPKPSPAKTRGFRLRCPY